MRPVLLVLVGFLLFTANASAGTVEEYVGIVFRGDEGVNTVTVRSTSPTTITVTDTSTPPTVAPVSADKCTQSGDTVTCTVSHLRASVYGGGGNDRLTVVGDVVGSLFGEEGDDVLTGGNQNDYLNGSLGNDVLEGGPGPDGLVGGPGADQLVGSTGADLFSGDDGDDTLRLDDGAADGTADEPADCGAGTDSATIDASDRVANCENTTTASGGGGSGSGGNGNGSGGGSGGGSSVEPVGEGSSVRTTPMPDVVGKDVAKARAAIDAAVPNVDIALVFNRKCGGKQTLDVIKQDPAAGQPLTTSQSQVARTSLDVCVPDKRFLADCDRRDLAKDIAQLPARGDAGMASQLLLRLGKCQTDVDVKLGGTQPVMSFDDLKRKGGKGAIEATLRCSRTQHDFAVALGEGLQVGNAGDASFALGEQGGKWVLPGDERALKSLVEIQVQQRTSGLQRSEVYVDADDVKPAELRPGQVFMTDAGGHASLFVRPTRPGKIRICVVQRVGETGVATWAAEVQVVRAPKTGKTWKTINGRHLLLTEQGRGKLVDPPKARMAALADVWNWILSVFGRTSRTVNTVSASQGSVSLKPRKVFQTARVGIAQITLDGTLSAAPAPPVAQQGPCLIWDNGKLKAVRCPTLVAPGGHAAVGISSNGSPLLAEGRGNVIAKAVDPKDVGRKLIGTDGSTLIGTDGSTLIGTDGATLIGTDGATLIGTDGSTLIGTDGASFTGPAAPAIVGPARGGIAAMATNAIAIDRAKLIGTDGSTLIGTDGASLIGTDGSTLVSDNGLG